MQKASHSSQTPAQQSDVLCLSPQFPDSENQILVSPQGRRTVLWAKYEDELGGLAEVRQKMGQAEELCNRLGFHLNSVKERFPSG